MLDHLDLKKENTTQLFEILDKKGLNQTNFADYMFLRRVNIGWDKCAAGSNLAKANIPCALKLVVPGWIASQTEADMLINVDQLLKSGRYQFQVNFMDLWGYLNSAHLYYYFYAFQVPYMDGQINKNDMKRAIDIQSVQTNLNEYLIDIIFADK